MNSVLHWLFATENPFKLWGFFPALIWLVPMAVIALLFGGLEYMGVSRTHGMVPLTWVWRCAPRILWFVAAPLIVWHFALVVTKAK